MPDGAASPGITEALIAAAATVPALVVVVVLVIFFLKHLATIEKRHDERDENARAFTKEQTDTMRMIADDCKGVIKENTTAMRETATAIARSKLGS